MSTSAKLGMTWDTHLISAMSKGAVTHDGQIIQNGTVLDNIWKIINQVGRLENVTR